MKLLLRFFLLVLAGFIPASVFAGDLSSEESFMAALLQETAYRHQVEKQSFGLTKKLCEVFELRKKHDMGLRPDPVSETLIRMIYFDAKESAAYRESLYEWIKIGNEGILTNLGLDKGSLVNNEDLHSFLFNYSRFTRTLVVTKGFQEAAEHCGDLNVDQLHKFLLQQELAQTSLIYFIGGGVALKGITAAGKMLGRAISPIFQGTAAARVASKVPWTKLMYATGGALLAYVGYGSWEEYSAGLIEDDKRNTYASNEIQKIKERTMQSALNYWMSAYKTEKAESERFKETEKYLHENQYYLVELKVKYEEELEHFGISNIQAIVSKYKSQLPLTVEEHEIFMKAVFFSAANVYLNK